MNFKSHFKFNKQERSGIFFLLLIIVVLQLGYFGFHYFSSDVSANNFTADIETQAKIDILKSEAVQRDTLKIYPFNPNFITDYKGYTLGLSIAEIDRLHTFRAKDKFVNSTEDFQRVTQISDSLLQVISVYFKFPEWTKKIGKQYSVNSSKYSNSKNKLEIKDLNSATAEELRVVSGIGEKLSARIIKFRDRLGGFLTEDQLYDVYGLEEEVVQRAVKQFKVLNPPKIEKININTASVETLIKLIYLQRNTAKSIINYRNTKGSITSFEELSKIENFPTEKIDRIALYLTL